DDGDRGGGNAGLRRGRHEGAQRRRRATGGSSGAASDAERGAEGWPGGRASVGLGGRRLCFVQNIGHPEETCAGPPRAARFFWPRGRILALITLAPDLDRATRGLGWHTLTPIQELAIPHLRPGRDLFAQAPTGTGKTGAFAPAI